jgi:hypothetical protein
MFEINEEEILEKVYKDAQEEIIKYGVSYILEALGFKVDRYNKGIEFGTGNSNSQFNYKLFEELFLNDTDIEQIIKITHKKVAYYVKKEILKTLESDLLQHMIKTVQEEVLRNSKLVLEQHIQTTVYRKLKLNLEEKLVQDVCSNPIIKNIMINKL